VTATEEKSEQDVIEIARVFLSGMLERMDIEAEIAVSEEEDKVVLDVKCDDVERIIGRRGQVVDALQHLVGKVVSKARTERSKPIVVDADGYRAKHIERLQSLAQRMGDKARETGTEVKLNPMSAHDRRIIHMTIAEITGLTTRSDGEGDDRHVVVIPEADAPERARAE